MPAMQESKVMNEQTVQSKATMVDSRSMEHAYIQNTIMDTGWVQFLVVIYIFGLTAKYGSGTGHCNK